MSYHSYKPYVSVAQRQKKAMAAAGKAQKRGGSLSPIEAHRGASAKTFWGKAWCDNLEVYSDYESRLPRGRSYVRSGAVIDLTISGAQVQAQVMGSSLYHVVVKVQPVTASQWKAIGNDCSGSIDSLVELLQGKLSSAVMQRICTPKTGLFPSPKELSFQCDCPDWAGMCKHVAAVMYGVGARLDQHPELLFELRGVKPQDLVGQASTGLRQSTKAVSKARVLDDAALADVFGLEMEATSAVPAKKATAKKATAKKATAKKVVAKKVPVKNVAVKKAVAKKVSRARSV
jgi:uncharacterized Zn finger protein